MSYIDGFVVPVPTGNKQAYRKVAKDIPFNGRRLIVR